MALDVLTQGVRTYLDSFKETFLGFKAPRGYGYYINNNDGLFQFDLEPLVTPFVVVNTAGDLTFCRDRIQVEGSSGDTVLDLRDNRLWTYQSGTTWTNTIVNIDSYMKPGRMYFSPYTRKVFIVDTLRRIEQLLGG
jgi:hypothetical protein